MFDLNLIKDREVCYRRRKALLGFVGGYALVLGLTIVLFASWCVGRWTQVETKERQLKALAAQIVEVNAKVGTRSKEPSLRDLGQPLEDVRRVVTGRMLWSQKLQMLSLAAADQLWITELAVEKQKTKTEAKKEEPSASAKADGGKAKEKEIVQRTLVVRGFARGGRTNAAERIAGLVEKLKQDTCFMDGLQGIESIAIRPSANQKETDSLTFELRCPFMKESRDG